MALRDNVRDRRRERIQQLIGRYESEGTVTPSLPLDSEVKRISSETSRPQTPEIVTAPPPVSGTQEQAPTMPPRDTAPNIEPDPERWWKERQKGQLYEKSKWEGMTGLPPTSRAPERPSDPPSGSVFFRGLMARLIVAGVLFAAAWGGMKLDLPRSAEARDWLAATVTRDMDFAAVEAWYRDTFAGSPSFLPFHRGGVESKEVTASLKREDTVLPVDGRLIQSFSQSGNGVKVAAAGGSDVRAIYAGRVQQVTTEAGGVTVLLQHPNQILTVYGNLAESEVKQGDWVETGDRLGRLKAADSKAGESVLRFSVQQQGKKLDPADVVAFD
jgi:stage IV sporulation protein FA